MPILLAAGADTWVAVKAKRARFPKRALTMLSKDDRARRSQPCARNRWELEFREVQRQANQTGN